MTERARTCSSPAFYQRWRELLFLHFSVHPDSIRSLVPSELEIDTFPDASGEEMAWVGLIPFRMEGVRPRFLPSIPSAAAFPETNVRTYVHRNGRPGVWFFSLDASSRLACKGGRDLFHLPYKDAKMNVRRDGDAVQYSSKRADGPALDIHMQVSSESRRAEPGTLEFFLLERYLLFSQSRDRWYGGNVHHAPYLARETQVISVAESLVAAAGLPSTEFTHSMFVDRVDVRIGRFNRLA